MFVLAVPADGTTPALCGFTTITNLKAVDATGNAVSGISLEVQ